MLCSSPHEFWDDAGRFPLETQVRRGVQLVWSSPSGTQTSPGEGATVIIIRCCDFALPWWPRHHVQAPMLQHTLQAPQQSLGQVLGGQSEGPASRQLQSRRGHLCTSLRRERWVTAGWTHLAASQSKPLHCLRLWQDFLGPPLHFPYLIKLKARQGPPCQGRVPSVPDNGSFWAARPALLTGTVRFGVMNATLLAGTC